MGRGTRKNERVAIISKRGRYPATLGSGKPQVAGAQTAGWQYASGISKGFVSCAPKERCLFAKGKLASCVCEHPPPFCDDCFACP